MPEFTRLTPLRSEGVLYRGRMEPLAGIGFPSAREIHYHRPGRTGETNDREHEQSTV